MFGFHRSLPIFQPPPCVCDEIEGRVREAIAIRDEMAKWPTPLQAWEQLQQMPVLRLKSEPKRDAWGRTWDEINHGNYGRLSTYTVHPVVQAPTPVAPRPVNPYSGVIYDGVPSSLGLAPSEAHVKRGDILNRGNGRYQVVGLETSMGQMRAMVVKLRD